MKRIVYAALAVLALALPALAPGRAEAALYPPEQPPPLTAALSLEPVAPVLALEDAVPWDPDDPFAAPVETAELDDMRGGFSFGGVEVSFGANVRTFVDGALALETVFNLTAAGVAGETVFDAGFTRLADALPDLAAAGVDLDGLAGADGIALIDAKGATAIAHRIDTGAVFGAIFNTADGRNIAQFIDVEIGISDYAAWTNAFSEQRLGFQLGTEFAHDAAMAVSSR